MKTSELLSEERIEKLILILREQKVIIDADLASLFGVTTKRLKEQVRRNSERFPVDFMFELSLEEKSEVVANCDHLDKLKFSSALPHAFTEHGALMAANVLNSERAVQVSIQVIRTFVHLRQLHRSNEKMSARLDKLESSSTIRISRSFSMRFASFTSHQRYLKSGYDFM